MKKGILFLFAIVCLHSLTQAQIQRGNVLVGANISNFQLDLGSGKNFSMTINPKAAWFIRDGLAIGGYLTAGINTAKDAGTDFLYGIGALGRYYITDKKIEVLRKSNFFLEANAGIEGYNPSSGDNTNGLGLGFGPGLAYFITPNIALEALLKYNGIIGFGSSATSNRLSLNIGFQIHLPGKRLKDEIRGMNK